MANKEKSFEEAMVRLEEILDKMNSGNVTLEESLALYEEADKLIELSSKRLSDAEKKIEKLMKNRQGELELGEDGNPKRESL